MIRRDDACPQEWAGEERAADQLGKQRGLDERAAEPAVSLGKQQAQRAEISQAGPQRRRVAHAGLQRAHIIERAALGKKAREGRLKQLLLFVQANVHSFPQFCLTCRQ